MDFIGEDRFENHIKNNDDCSENDSIDLLTAALSAGKTFSLDDFIVISQQPEILSAPIGDLIYGLN